MLNAIHYLLMGIAVAMPLGPINIEIIRRAARHNFWSGFLVGVGAYLADLISIIIVFLGFSYLFNTPKVHTIMYSLGGLVLIYAGYMGIKDFYKKNVMKASKTTKKNSFVTGVLFGFSSPYIFIWWIAIFGSTIAENFGNISLAFQSAMFILLGVILWETFLAAGSSYSRKFLNEKVLRFISLISGIAIIGFGIYFEYQAAILII